MASDLTPAEVRLVRALCGAGPMGITPTGLAKMLSLSVTTIGNLSLNVERKGFCSRERYGMRVFLRPTTEALEFVQRSPADLPAPPTAMPFKPRRPRTPG